MVNDGGDMNGRTNAASAAEVDSALYCPWCGYNLTGVQELGMMQCPECGKVIPFEYLRQRANLHLDLSSHSYWHLAGRFGLMKRRMLYGMSHASYCSLRLPEISRGYKIAVAVLVTGTIAIAAALAVLDPPSAIIASVLAVGYPMGVLVVHLVMTHWTRWLLGAVGCPDVEAKTGRIMTLAATQYLMMASVTFLNVAMAALCAFAGGGVVLYLGLPGFIISAFLLVGLGAAWYELYVWAWTIETRYFALETTWPRVLARLNPSLLLVPLSPCLLVLALVSLKL